MRFVCEDLLRYGKLVPGIEARCEKIHRICGLHGNWAKGVWMLAMALKFNWLFWALQKILGFQVTGIPIGY